uniref:Putative axis inhibition protein, axin n=1 Tax=Schistosoma mansoni TaxID=6183 RepID=A0A5K4EY18_SCHMA
MDVVIDSRDSVSNLDQSRWGINLDNLLNDSDGVEFFNKFLSYKHSASHLLDFWFACKGFRSNADLSNPDKLFQVAKVIYRTYIKSGASHAVPLPYILKQNINECLSSYHHGYKKGLSSNASVQPPDRCLFDSAQNVVKSLLEQKYYPEFLTFIACPSNLLCITSNGPLCSDRKTRNKYLEFLYSDYKLESRRSNRTKHKSFSEYNRFSADQSPGAKNFHPLFTPDYYLANNNNCNVPSTSEQISTNPFVRLTTSWTSSTIQSPVIHSAQPDLHYDKSCKSNHYHHRSTSRHQFLNIHDHPLPGGIPKMPMTANDSILTDNHLQQMDNHTKDTTNSKRQHDDSNICDSQSPFANQSFFVNNNNNPHPVNSSSQILTQTPITSSSGITMQSVNSTSNNIDLSFIHSLNLQQTHQSDNLIKESNNNNNPPKINWTIRKQTNLAESDPVSFVQLLTDRLEKVKESRGKLEKLMSLVNHQVDEKHPTESKNTLPIGQTDSYGFISVNQHNSSLHSDHLNWSQLKPNSFINTTNSIMNETNSSTIQQHTLNYPHHSTLIMNTGSQLLNGVNKSQDAQEILDDHCSRIWADESDMNMDTQLLLSYSKRQQSDIMHTPVSSQPLLMTPYPSMLCDTLVNSMKHNTTGIVRNGSNITEYELKKSTEQSRLAAVVVSSIESSCVPSSNNNNNNNNNNNRTAIPDNSHRRRHITASGGNVSYRSFSRPNKADLRSIASWDSGVVSNYYEKKHRLHHHHHDDLDIMDDTVDTASILEAASLQALSSSTTELALVNGEVTAKLVEKIIRHYPRGIFDGDDDYIKKNHTNTIEQSYFKSSQFKETSNLNYAYPFSSSRLRRRSKQCESFYESPSSSLSYPIPGVHLNSTCSANNNTTATTGTCQQQHPGIMIPCECHRCIHCTHSPSALNDHLSANYCNCNYIHQLNDKPQQSTNCHSQQLPIITASDTSSTFDSGISSAYDQLPLRKQVNNNRENRSQSLHSWQTNPNFKGKHLSTPRGNRTHSASKSMYDNNNNDNDDSNNNNSVTTTYTRECPLKNCLISSCYEFDSKQTTPGQQFSQHTMNDLHLCDSCSSIHHHYHNLRHHYRHSHLLHHHHSHCPELMVNDLKYKYDMNNDFEKPTSGKLLQHWLQLQQNSSEPLHASLRPPATTTTTTANDDDDNDEQKVKSLSSDNAVLLSNDNSQAQISKTSKESSSHARKSHHHHHHHSHRKSSAHRIGNNNNVNIATNNSSTNNKNPKHSINFDNNLESTNNIRLDFDENNDDHDENNTSSTRLNSKLSSSSSVMMQQSCHTTSTTGSSGAGLVVGYYLCDDPVPYRTVWTGGSHNPPPSSSSISSSGLFVEVNDQSETVDNFQTKLSNQSLLTLGQFKQLIAKKGVYRYFFKKPNDEFGTGVVHEELTNDNAILPLWEGKVVARVERAD